MFWKDWLMKSCNSETGNILKRTRRQLNHVLLRPWKKANENLAQQSAMFSQCTRQNGFDKTGSDMQ